MATGWLCLLPWNPGPSRPMLLPLLHQSTLPILSCSRPLPQAQVPLTCLLKLASENRVTPHPHPSHPLVWCSFQPAYLPQEGACPSHPCQPPPHSSLLPAHLSHILRGRLAHLTSVFLLLCQSWALELQSWLEMVMLWLEPQLGIPCGGDLGGIERDLCSESGLLLES